MAIGIGLLAGLAWLAVWMGLRRREQRGIHGPLPAADWLAGGLLLLLTVGFFWRTVSGDVYQPADGGDLVSFLFPTYRFAASQLHHWSLPLWNPHLYGGAPFISDIQAGFLYLPNLLLFLLWPDFAYIALQWLAIGHIYWAGLGVYVLLRTLTWDDGQPVTRPAAFLGALAFAFSDPLLTHLGNLNLIAVLSWLPWVLAAYHRGLTTANLRRTAGAALLFTLANYAGHAQSTFYIGLAVGLYTLFEWGRRVREQPDRTSLVPRVTAAVMPLLVFIFLSGLLSAPILWPALDLTPFTERTNLAYQETVAYSLAPTQAIGLLTPGFFGHGPALHWSLWSRVETPYAGVAALILALAGLLLASTETRHKLWPWLGLALVGFVTALGVYAIVHGWLTWLLPIFGQFRAPARALVLWTLGIAILAAVGVDAVQNAFTFPQAEQNQKSKIKNQKLPVFFALLKAGAFILLGICTPLSYLALLLTQENETIFLRASVAALSLVLATGFWLATWAILKARQWGWLTNASFVVALIGLLFFDLSATGAYTDISPTNPTQGFLHPELVAWLKADPDLFRIDTRTEIEGAWQPDAAALHGLQDVGGVANPLLLRHWQRLWEATGGRQTRLYDMLNVKYVIVRDGTPLPEGKFTLAFDAPDELSIYQNQNFMQRAWVVHSVQSVQDEAAAFIAMQQPDFDPSKEAVVQGQPPGLATIQPTDATESVAVTHFGSSELTLQVQTATPGLLVLSEIWHPGWRATVNGETTAVLQVNGGLRGLLVPAGTMTVHLWFAPAGWRRGLIAFGLGGVLLVFFLGRAPKLGKTRGFHR